MGNLVVKVGGLSVVPRCENGSGVEIREVVMNLFL
jgi:hypothetical protein